MAKEENALYRVKVRRVAHIRGAILATVHLLSSGRIDMDTVLEDPVTGGKWLVLDLSFISHREWARGIRGISVKNLGEEELRENMILIAHNP